VFGIVSAEEPIRVRLLLEPKQVVSITERQWHASQRFQTRADSRVEMSLETTGRKEHVRWILFWMADVKVLTPKSLQDRIAEKLRDFADNDETKWPNNQLITAHTVSAISAC